MTNFQKVKKFILENTKFRKRYIIYLINLSKRFSNKRKASEK